MNAENVENLITSVMREFKWSPEIIGDLFFDAEDYMGLIYWHRDIEAQSKKLNEKIKK